MTWAIRYEREAQRTIADLPTRGLRSPITPPPPTAAARCGRPVQAGAGSAQNAAQSAMSLRRFSWFVISNRDLSFYHVVISLHASIGGVEKPCCR